MSASISSPRRFGPQLRYVYRLLRLGAVVATVADCSSISAAISRVLHPTFTVAVDSSGTPATVDGPPVSGVLHALSVRRPILCTGWIRCSVAPPGFTSPVMRLRAAGRSSAGTAGRLLQRTGSDPLPAVVIRRAGERSAAPLGLRRPSRHGDRHESHRGDPRVVGVPVPVRYCDRGGRECLPSRREHGWLLLPSRQRRAYDCTLVAIEGSDLLYFLSLLSWLSYSRSGLCRS